MVNVQAIQDGLSMRLIRPSKYKSPISSFDTGGIRGRIRTLLFALWVFALQGCTIYQLEPGSAPVVVGTGSVDEQPAVEGKVYRVVSPGLGIQIGYLGSGISFGWNESLVFCVEGESESSIQSVDCVAAQESSYGLHLFRGGFSLGYSRTFGVPPPTMKKGIQVISYSRDEPTKTVVIRKIMP